MKRIALGLAVIVIAAVVFHSAILAGLGSYLVNAGAPHKADLIVVLAGDSTGHRIIKSAELVRDGYAPKILVSGPAMLYDFAECDLEIPFAVKRGFPESYFTHFEHQARSTQAEADVIVPELRRLGVHSVLLVTSDFHTRRATKIFRRAAPDLTIDPVAAPDPFFTANGWWHNREGRKTFALEWMKTVSEWVGM